MFRTISITVLAFVITSLILALNFNTRSMLSWEDERFERALVEHENNPPSSLRPITSRMMRALVESSSVSYRTAFILTQYPALFVMLLCFGLTLHKAGFDHRRQTYGVLIAGFAYPVLCAHFVPNFTWDDIWAYLGLVWFLYFLLDKKLYAAALALAFAAMNRENALAALPAFYFFRDTQDSQKGAALKQWIAPALIPLTAYIVYRLWLYPDALPGRFTRLPVNFTDLERTRQSLYSLFVSYGWIWTVCALGYLRAIGHRCSTPAKLAHSALWVGMLGVLVTLVAASARETRLFFISFVFVIPCALLAFGGICSEGSAAPYVRIIRSWRFVTIAALTFALSVALSIWLFPRFEYLPMLDFHRIYFALNLTLSILAICIWNTRLKMALFASGAESDPQTKIPPIVDSD